MVLDSRRDMVVDFDFNVGPRRHENEWDARLISGILCWL